MKKIKRRIHFYAVKVLNADGVPAEPRVLMQRLSALVDEGTWSLNLSEERSQGMKSVFRDHDRSLEGIIWYDKTGNFPDVANGVDSEPLDTQGRPLRDKVHMVWWDLCNVTESMGAPREWEGCLVWEFNQTGPRVEAFADYVSRQTKGEFSLQISRLTEPGALEKLKTLSQVRYLRTRIKDKALDLPEKYQDGPVGLGVAQGMTGLHEIEIRYKPKKRGILNLGRASKDRIEEMAGGGPNVDIRICFEDGLELPLADAFVVSTAKDVPAAAPGAKSVDSQKMLEAIRDAYNSKRHEVRAFFGRNVG